jgi:hypothetical protein
LSNWRALLQTLVDYKGLTHDPDFAAFIPRAGRLRRPQRHGPKMRFGLYLEQGIHIIGNFLKHNNSLPRKLDSKASRMR